MYLSKWQNIARWLLLHLTWLLMCCDGVAKLSHSGCLRLMILILLTCVGNMSLSVWKNIDRFLGCFGWLLMCRKVFAVMLRSGFLCLVSLLYC